MYLSSKEREQLIKNLKDKRSILIKKLDNLEHYLNCLKNY